MSIVTLISFIICILIIASSFRSGIDIFSPGRIFFIVWSLAIGLTDLKLSSLQHQWALEVWIKILIGPFAFILGTLLIYTLNLDTKIYSLHYLRKEKNYYKINNEKLYRTVVFLFFLFLFGYLIIYLKTGNVPLFSSNPGKTRSEFTMFGIGLFLHNVLLIVFFTSVYYLVEKNNLLRRRILILCSTFSTILYGITLQRYQIFITIFLVIVLLYYTTYKVKFRFVFIFIVILVTFFFLVSSFRAGEIIIMVLYKMSKMKISPDYAIFTEPYMYIVMNLENYARSIAKTEFYTYGYYTFDFITAISGLKHWISGYLNLKDTPFLISSFNTYSAFWTFYRDFGLLGIFFIPFGGGILFSSLYYSLRRNPTVLKIGIYGMFHFAIIFSFFNSIIGFLWFVYNLTVIILVFAYIKNDKSLCNN
ncbi:MAG: oligosaccharide repeat unit polymerase [Ignavibacteriaceae bacterium]|nr:oligosaccharide repeat unit polymerase [Ignavibacteriaceae bacterium]